MTAALPCIAIVGMLTALLFLPSIPVETSIDQPSPIESLIMEATEACRGRAFSSRPLPAMWTLNVAILGFLHLGVALGNKPLGREREPTFRVFWGDENLSWRL